MEIKPTYCGGIVVDPHPEGKADRVVANVLDAHLPPEQRRFRLGGQPLTADKVTEVVALGMNLELPDDLKPKVQE